MKENNGGLRWRGLRLALDEPCCCAMQCSRKIREFRSSVAKDNYANCDRERPNLRRFQWPLFGIARQFGRRNVGRYCRNKIHGLFLEEHAGDGNKELYPVFLEQPMEYGWRRRYALLSFSAWSWGVLSFVVTASVCIATLNRPMGLDRLLSSLEAQNNAPEFEVVVIDNNPHGTARPVVANFADRLALTYVV